MTNGTTQIAAAAHPVAAPETLRREQRPTRAPVEGPTVAREKIPDHSATLGDITEQSRVATERVEKLERRPALDPTRATVPAEIVRLSDVALESDRNAFSDAGNIMSPEIGAIDTPVSYGRTVVDPRGALFITARAPASSAALVMTILPGALALCIPASWKVLDWLPAQTLGLSADEQLSNEGAAKRLFPFEVDPPPVPVPRATVAR